jgi:alanyl-tRNA synthetase
MRRAMRHGKKLGARDPFLYRLVDVLVAEMGGAYPDLRGHRDAIARVVRSEEERFDAVLTSGLARLEDVLDRAAAGTRIVPGEEMFRLYDSLGVPVDFVEDLAGERGLGIDRAGFEVAMEAQRERARSASAFEIRKAEDFRFRDDDARQRLAALPDRFEGYTTTTVDGVAIEALFDEARRQVEVLREGQAGYVVLTRTPFYLEAGGQVSDTGDLVAAPLQEGVVAAVEEGEGSSRARAGGTAHVDAMGRLAPGGPRVHRVRVSRGELHEGAVVTARVDVARRDAIRRNHTATHLLHAALRTVLGTHVKQAGSLVAPDRLRFDFVHFAPITRDEIARIERLVNEQVYRNTGVETAVMRTDEAVAEGAMALFGEKYGDEVRVVAVPGFSKELCGGTHCRATGDIGPFAIVSEGGVAAGVRRIEAFTGEGAVEWMQQRTASLDAILGALNAPADQAVPALERLQHELKRLHKENSDLKVRVAIGGGTGAAAAASDVTEVGGVKLVARRVAGLDKQALRTLTDSLRDRLGSGVVVIASEGDGKVSLVVSVTKDLTARVRAGDLVKRLAPIVGGGGGGRPDFAEAGGKDAAKIDALLAAAPGALGDLLASAAV